MAIKSSALSEVVNYLDVNSANLEHINESLIKFRTLSSVSIMCSVLAKLEGVKCVC